MLLFSLVIAITSFNLMTTGIFKPILDDSIAIYRTDKSTVNKIKLFLVRYYINRNNYDEALSYIKISFIALTFNFAFFMFQSIVR